MVNLYGDKTIELNKNVLPNNNSNDNQLNGLMKNMAKLVSSGDKGSLGYYSMLTATTSAMIHKIARQQIERYQPDILINIPNDSAITFDFHKADELIKIGEMVASEQITKYLKL
ncbi:MAG: hypothetical protein ABJH04_19000 [Cyclobacteriaceae bacterium]